MANPPSRRTLLKVTGAVIASGAGCLDISDIQDLALYNNADRELTVTTTVTQVSDDEETFSDITTIPPEETRYYQNPIRRAGTYEIRVSVESGPENSFEWEAPEDESYGLRISIGTDEIGFSELVS